MKIEKSKLPKRMSYPLRSSIFAAALSEGGIALDTHLIIAPSEIFFDAFFWPPNQNVAYERLYVRAGAVPSNDARDARLFMETSVIPDFVSWVRELVSLPIESPRRRSEQYFRREWPGAGIN